MDKENSPNQDNCQQSKTVIINGINYPNIPDDIRKQIEEIAKNHGTLVRNKVFRIISTCQHDL